MRSRRLMVIVALGTLALGTLALGATAAAAQRGWVMSLKRGTGASLRSGVLNVGPRASIPGAANGLYCTPLTENGLAVHDLGSLVAGLRVRVTVESFADGFNPAAAVIAPIVGEKGGNGIQTVTFYDNDSGGDGDALIQFVTPHSGTYILVINDFTDASAGCYRYQVVLE